MKSRSVSAYAYRNQEANVDLAPVSKSKKRKACRQDGSRDRPIIIDDSDSPEQEPANRRQLGHQRRSQHTEGRIRVPAPADTFTQVRELLRSSKNIVVISGAGISANAGFSTFQQMRKS
ncbi:hypothetical protein BKA61DRAFT_741493 [Leptodontidium sp. MPI-SDFR-AT-0119]|nr:hypothetical protein BKA61DRAFT_741493 [Leptodontidium sp. MPI-SDFR-AT-0119]